MRSLRPSLPLLEIPLGLAMALAGGILLYEFWSYLGLPDNPAGYPFADMVKPHGLGLFISLLFPAAAFFGTLVLNILVRLLPRTEGGREEDLILPHLFWDAATYLALPLAAVILFLWDTLGNAFLALGLLYLALLSAKAAILISLLARGFLGRNRGPGPSGRRARTALFLVVLCLSGLAAAWTEHAVSSVSDEAGYLLLTHSWAQGLEPDIKTAAKAKEYRSFYWTRWNDQMAMDQATLGTLFYPQMAAPFYILGGRLGVMLMNSLFMALLAVVMLAWLEKLGTRTHLAALATGLVICSPPVFFLSQQAYPDVPGMLLAAICCRLLLWIPVRPVYGLLSVAFTALVLTGLKFRLAPISIGFILAASFMAVDRLRGRAAALTAAGAVAALPVLAALLAPPGMWPQGLAAQVTAYVKFWGQAETWWSPIWIFFRGLAVDQTFGLLAGAPVFLLALGGIAPAFRRDSGHSLALILPVVLYLAAVCFLRWIQWYGGFNSFGRYVIPVLPLAAWFMIPCLKALDRPWRRLLIWLPASWGLFLAAFLNLLPHLRYGRPVGINPLVELLQAQLGLEMHHLLPSAFTLSPVLALYVALAAALAMLYGLAGWFWGKGPDEPAVPWNRAEVLAIPLSMCLAATALTGSALAHPPSFLEAEHMTSRSAPLYGDYTTPSSIRGRSLLDGDSMEGDLTFPGGPVNLAVKAQTKSRGGIVLEIDGKKRVEAPFDLHQHQVTLALGPVEAGTRRVRLYWNAEKGRENYLLVDYLILQNPRD